jgi:hypothetical protein
MLTLTNSTSLELTFGLEAQDVTVREGKRVFVTAGELSKSIAATAVFSQKTVVVPAGESRSVTVIVTIPEGATTRAVLALFRGTTLIPNGRTHATASLGALLTFTLSEKMSLTASEIAVTSQSNAQNAAFEQTFDNVGTEPLVPEGVAVILDESSKFVGRTSFRPHRLLPGERGTLRAELPTELQRGKYRVLSTFAFEGRSTTRMADFIVR